MAKDLARWTMDEERAEAVARATMEEQGMTDHEIEYRIAQLRKNHQSRELTPEEIEEVNEFLRKD